VRRLPRPAELAAAQLVFVADPDPADRATLAAAARAAGVLVHVEDAPGLCDMQAPAVLRRGDLAIAVSTAGGSPGLATRICRFLGGLFGPEWTERLDEVAGLRRRWRETGAPPSVVARQTEAWVDRQGWLPPAAPAPARRIFAPSLKPLRGR
jgi:precorrin-2 dehydrogenase/sirohydrochlorin ferrochelatase